MRKTNSILIMLAMVFMNLGISIAQSSDNSCQKWDININDKYDLPDIIYGLQILSGVRNQSDFIIKEVKFIVNVINGGEREDLAVLWEGNPKFPVTMIYRPRSGWDCPMGGCQTVQYTFSQVQNPLIGKDFLYCYGYSQSFYVDYEVLLKDADGRETSAKAAGFNCLTSGRYFDISSAVADNPAVNVFSQNIYANMDNWILTAKDHWKNRSADSWEKYIQQLVSPNPPLNPPNPPQPPAKSVTPICEATGEGRCFYIDAVFGNDSSAGTYEKPWKTYKNLVNCNSERIQIRAGDVFYFMSGEYKEVYSCGHGFMEVSPDFSACCIRNAKGTPEYPIILKAYPGEHPVFCPKIQIQISGDISINVPAISLGWCDNIIIDGFEIRDTYGGGVWYNGGKNVEIKNCWIHNNKVQSVNNPAGIRIAFATGSIKIHHNLVYDNLDIERGVTTSPNIYISKCTGGNISVYENIVYNSPDLPQNMRQNGIIWKHPASASPDLDNISFEVSKNAIFNSLIAIGSSIPNSWIHHNLLIKNSDETNQPIYLGELGGGDLIKNEIIEHNTIFTCLGTLIFTYVSLPDKIGLMAYRNNIVINITDSYNREGGICGYCDFERYYDVFVSKGNLAFDNNVYVNPNFDLNTETNESKFGAWGLFSMTAPCKDNTSKTCGNLGFKSWQALGYDKNSIVYYTPVDLKTIVH